MKKRKSSFSLLLVIAVGILLSGCASESIEDDMSDSPEKNEQQLTEISLAMVMDMNGVNDQSINEIAWKGITEFAEENGLEKVDHEYEFLQSETAEDYYANLNNFISRDFDLIFGTGTLMEEQVMRVAEENPDARLAMIDSVIEADNVANVMFRDQEGAFLAGVAAALKTKTNKVGFIGGMEIPVVERFESGFRAGIREVNPDVEIEVIYLGSFTDQEQGKEASNKMYAAGTDIIFQVAGESGQGVFAEAKERKQDNPNADVWVIGSIVDQYDEGKVNDSSVTLTSVLKHVNTGVKDVATKTMRGQFPGGKVSSYGLQQGAFSIADSRGLLSKEMMDQINIWRNEIIAGNVDCCA